MSTSALAQNGLTRALRFSLVVGTILVMINQSPRVLNGPYDVDLAIRALLTYLTPFLVSLFSTAMTSKDAKVDQLKIQNELDASVRFPTMNPSPVLRIDVDDGTLIFANEAATLVCKSLSISSESRLTQTQLDMVAANADAGTPFETSYQGINYELFAVRIADHGFFNVYGKDVTATRALTRFPSMNPNPVLRVDRNNGALRFSNESAQAVCEGLCLHEEQSLSAERLTEFKRAAETKDLVEVEHQGRLYTLSVVDVPGFGFLNAYGTDITAQRALTRFPSMNPNPVLRVGRTDGALKFANASARAVCEELCLHQEQSLSAERLTEFKRAAETKRLVEVEHQGRLYALSVVDVPGLGFLNAYGTDITAQRALTRFPAMNPNPVLRIARETGQLRFQNAAANDVCLGLNLNASTPLSLEWLDTFKEAAQNGLPVKMSYLDRHFELKVVDVDGFDFLNAYGRDVTAQYLVDSLHQENQRLLRNVLPSRIIDRLKQGEELIADNVPEMSVLFADLAGFTELSANLPPKELLTILNDIFSVFDGLAERHQLEKIKTIGDAYMVVGGVDNNPMHAHQIIALALDMQAAIERYNQDSIHGTLAIRIGINVGEAVAGVIGIKKFIYDVWGDTVNVASRMESTGIPGRIQVTEETVQTLGDAYQFEARGPIEVKGKGLMNTFLVSKS